MNEKKGYPAGSQKNNNNNNKFIQYYHFVQMLAIKMTISKTAKFKEMKIWWNGRINYVKCLKGEILAASLAVWERESRFSLIGDVEDGGWAGSQKGKRIACTGTTLVFLFLKLAAAQELCKEKKAPNKLLISWLVSLPYGP